MALKKPSDFFKKEKNSIVDTSIHELAKKPEMNTFYDAFDSLKNNLSNFEEVSEKVNNIQIEMKDLLKKEDLDRALMSQLIIVDRSISEVQDKVKSLNKKTLFEIRSDVSELTKIVENLLEVDIPKYKKKVLNSEVRLSSELNEFKEDVEKKVEKFYDALNEYSDVVQVFSTVASIENYIQEHHKDFVNLKEEVYSEISQIPIGNIQENIDKLERKIDFINETYSRLQSEIVDKKIISEQSLSEPPNVKNSDPLTPLDQKFVTLDQFQEHYRLFVNRIQQQLSTLGGGGETKLKYLDDIVGIATNASAYNGKYLKYDHSLGKFVFDSVGSASGVQVTNVLYVTKDGLDTNSGQRLGDAKATIAGAVSVATTGTVIKVSAGTYIENNPITLPEQVSIIGDSLREVSVQCQNPGDLFYVTNGNYIAEMSFTGSSNSGAIFSFSPSGAGNIVQSPYIQNCTNFIPNSTGIKIDGNNATGNLKSMVLDSYTQYNQGGIGASITNSGYAQLVSMFTICNDVAVYCGSGGACDLTNSNSSFGNYALIADGVSSEQYSGTINSQAEINSSTFVVSGIGTNRPYDGQVVYFDNLYYEVTKFAITNGGSGYSSPPLVTIDSPSEPWGINATALARVSNGSVYEIVLVSSGRGYTTTPTVTISAPNSGINTATATATLKPTYYRILSSTAPSAGISTITVSDNVPYAVGVGSTVPFFKQSRILASGHSLEYIGSGVNINTALPSVGGVAIPENEIDMRNGGLVVYTSTDQSGNFRIGDGLVINQATGTISGDAYTKSLFSTMTPFILALGGDQ